MALCTIRSVLPAALSVAAFHLAYEVPALSFLIVVYLFGLIQLTRLSTSRQAFYYGLAVGYAVYAPHLTFFWTIFGWPAVALWTVLAFWLGLFVALGRLCRLQFGRVTAAILIPFVWTGLEYFRSELYYLRFSWLNIGYAFAESPQLIAMTNMGMYGVGFLAALAANGVSLLPRRMAALGVAVVCLVVGIAMRVPPRSSSPQSRRLPVAGMQLEFPAPQEVPGLLDQLLERFPTAELFVLSEYTFNGLVPERVKAWCRDHRKYLIAGGKNPGPNNDFFNTAFVVGPEGTIVFEQVKSVPIQFFHDGLPAAEQKVWDSPWGRIGICICYDLSYRRVVDGLIAQGAEAIVVPTMDVTDWGERQHQLHARVGPVRAAELRVPLFRLCSSGISQLIDDRGRVGTMAGFRGERQMMGGNLDLIHPGRLPLDHWLGPFSVGVTLLILARLAATSLKARFSKS